MIVSASHVILTMTLLLMVKIRSSYSWLLFSAPDSGLASRTGWRISRTDGQLYRRHHHPVATKASSSFASSSSSSTSPIDTVLMDMDVVVYSIRNEADVEAQERMPVTSGSAPNLESPQLERKRYLGAVQEDGRICPLSVWSEDPAFGNCMEFVVDEHDRPGFDPEQVIVHQVITDPSALSYGSRQVGGGMGPGNPHGEESELLYYVERGLLENVSYRVNPELEIFW